ncbi:hypothetical protein XM47_00690 [Catenovulum maritimum]|uniref:Solute-binding protein family 3/N-terminal domain-containing protein n=1 Tax=Catenovulum maritimum TaxID=1513271 RepID=A0A0J8GZM4_9ALTE|nr:hypothetical protein XM47_00690 [Catenovulum maritimum]
MLTILIDVTKKIFINSFIISLIFIFSITVYAAEVFTYNQGETEDDDRNRYDKKLLVLALEATKADFGDYVLQPTKRGSNYKRNLKLLEQNFYTNFFIQTSIDDDILTKFKAVEIPIERGIVGYRVGIINPERLDKFNKNMSLDELKRLSIIQGDGWLDTQILKQNGYNVFGISNYDSLFRMISLSRADILLRGANEISYELDNFITKYPNLSVEPHFIFHYPLPRFFITSKSNLNAAKRIEVGLNRAFEDGSFMALWQSHFGSSLKQLNLKSRRVIELKNSSISSLATDYTKYNFTLAEMK